MTTVFHWDIFLEFVLGIVFSGFFTWFLYIRRNRPKSLPVEPVMPQLPTLDEIKTDLTKRDLPEADVEKILEGVVGLCERCGIDFGEALQDHLDLNPLHKMKADDYGEVDFKERQHQLVVLRLKPGQSLPPDMEHERPISVQVEGNELVFHYYQTHLKRIK